jgi:tRNA A-37 threonylcarbamoyl transferase component Bud32
MTAAPVCPQCGKPLPSDAPQGLCPECLLKAALPGQSAFESSATGVYEFPATALTLEAGVRLKYFGDYELLEEIARGGMGVVWKARQASLNRIVALKMIRAGALASPEEVQRFLREAEAAANLQHPNIVAIHEVGEHEGHHYFTMDYVAGRDLGALVKNGPLPPNRAARYVQILANAIHFAHQRGTLHRDLKPQNVLIDSADQPRITDFGLAKPMREDSRLTQSGVVIGSPSYMPPEQAAGRTSDLGPASDVYALGAMLYELLTGRPPFRGATALATLREVMEAEPDSPRRLKADIPPDLETICLKCLEKLPHARYPTAEALALELDRYLHGEPILARPASPVRKAVSWARRHPRTLVAAAALVMVALAFGVIYLLEENSFLRALQADPALRAQQANPALTRDEAATFPRSIALFVWMMISGIASLGGMHMCFLVRARARGLSLMESRGAPAKVLSRPIQPLAGRTRTLAIGASLVLIGCAIMVLLLVIRAYLWEWKPAVFHASGSALLVCGLFYAILLAFSSIYLALAILSMVIRDYRLVNFGIPATTSREQLIKAQTMTMMGYLLMHDTPSAIKAYREAAPDASLEEANQYVARLSSSWPPVEPPLSLTTLNWKALLECALFQTVFLGLWWTVTPQSPSFSNSVRFACSFLFGMSVLACLSVKGPWKRLLLLAPAIALLILSEIAVPRLAQASSRSVLPYFCGVFFGFWLMFAAFSPRPKKV